jgi:hypothetical protein
MKIKSKIGIYCFRFIFILWILTVLTGCQMAHISTLRGLQDDFNHVAAKEHIEARKVLSPTPDSVSSWLDEWDGRSVGLPGYDQQQAWLERYTLWRNVQEGLAGLIRTGQIDLNTDNLLGTALAMETMAHWRRAFYGHALKETGVLDGEYAEVPLTEVQRKAENLVKNERIQPQLRPFDSFILKLMPGMILYDIATIERIRLIKSDERDRQKWEKSFTQVMDAADEIASHRPSGKVFEQTLYWMNVRNAVLMAAHNLRAVGPLKRRPGEPADEPYQKAKERFEKSKGAFASDVNAIAEPAIEAAKNSDNEDLKRTYRDIGQHWRVIKTTMR